MEPKGESYGLLLRYVFKNPSRKRTSLLISSARTHVPSAGTPQDRALPTTQEGSFFRPDICSCAWQVKEEELR